MLPRTREVRFFAGFTLKFKLASLKHLLVSLDFLNSLMSQRSGIV